MSRPGADLWDKCERVRLTFLALERLRSTDPTPEPFRPIAPGAANASLEVRLAPLRYAQTASDDTLELQLVLHNNTTY